MTVNLQFILLVAAIVCFLVQAFGVPTGRVGIGWVGLAFFAGAFLV